MYFETESLRLKEISFTYFLAMSLKEELNFLFGSKSVLLQTNLNLMYLQKKSLFEQMKSDEIQFPLLYMKDMGI